MFCMYGVFKITIDDFQEFDLFNEGLEFNDMMLF